MFSSFTFENIDIDNYKLTFKNYAKAETFEIIQDYPAIDIWTTISSLVFTSSSLPVVASQISNPNIFYNNQLISNSNNSNNSNKIITDKKQKLAGKKKFINNSCNPGGLNPLKVHLVEESMFQSSCYS